MCVLKCAGACVLQVCEHMSAHICGDHWAGYCSRGAVRSLLSPPPQNRSSKCDSHLHGSSAGWTGTGLESSHLYIRALRLAHISSPCILFGGFYFQGFFLCLCVCVYGYVCTCGYRVPWRPEEGVGSFRARVVVSWQLPSMGAKSRTPVLWGSSEHS